MLAHKTRTRNTNISGITFLLVATAGVAFAVLALPRLLPSSAEVSAGNSSFSTYRDSNSGYSISYPANWKIVAPVSGSSVTTLASSIAPAEQAGGRYSIKGMSRTPTATGANNFSKLDIVSYEFEEPMSAVEFLATRSKSVVDGKLVNMTVAGQDALMIEVQTAEALAQREENLIYKSIFVTKGNQGFIIAGFADADTFNQIVQSFKIG